MIDRYRSSNDVHARLKDLKKEMMSINKFNSHSNSNNVIKGRYVNNGGSNGNIKSIIYSKGVNDNAKRLFRGNDDSNKRKGEMILEGLGVDKSFERKLYGDVSENGVDMCNEDANNGNEDDTNFLITDRQEKSVLKGTLVDHNEKGDYEDMNEIKNQLDSAIARSVQNKKQRQCTLTCNSNNNNNVDNEIDKQHELIITSQSDINVNNCNVIFKSDSFNYGSHVNNNNNNIINHNTMNINSTSTTNSHSKQTQNIVQCNNNNNNNNLASSEDIEVTLSIPINFQSTTSLDIVKSTKHLHEHRYSNEEQDNEHEQMCCSSTQPREDNNDDDDNVTTGKGHVVYDHQEIKEEDEENDESVGVSVMKHLRKRLHNNNNNGECRLVIDEIKNQKQMLLNMKPTSVNNDYARLQKIKTLLHKTTHAQVSTTTSNNAIITSLNRSPLTITNTSLTIHNNNNNNNVKSLITHHHPLLSTHNTYLVLSNEQAFNILSTPKIYSPNNIHTSQPLSSPLHHIHHPQTQFNPNELHSEIDTFLNNIKLRNKSKESHLTSLKLQKAQELQQLKTKQQFFAKQKQQVSHSHKSAASSTSSCINNTNVHRNNIAPSTQQQETTTTSLSSCVKKNTYTSIFNTLLEEERYNTLRNNMSKRCVKDNKYAEMFNQDVEKESDLFLKKVKEDIRDIKHRRKVKEELNAFVVNGSNACYSRYVGIGKRNNCVMPVNSIDGVVDAREIGFFTNYMNNNSSHSNSSNINTQSVLGINSFNMNNNNYTFKK